MRVWQIALGASVVASLALPATARACAWPPGPQRVTPSADEYPSNAAVLMRGNQMSTDGLSATIDDVPVAIVIDDALSQHELYFDGWQQLALRFEPAPEVGQTVRLVGGTCGIDCVPIDLTYVTTEPDLEIAESPGSMSFDVLRYDQPPFESCGTRGSFIEVDLQVDFSAFDAEPFLELELAARNDAAQIDWVWRGDETLISSPRLEFGPDMIGDAFPLDGWCVEARAIDASGNVTLLATSCEGCMFAEVDQNSGIELKPFPDGPCDQSGTGTSDGSSGTTTGDDPPQTGTGVADGTGDGPGDGSSSGEPSTETSTAGAEMELDTAGDRGCACGAGSAESEEMLGTGICLLLVAARRRRPTSRPLRRFFFR